MEYFYKRIIRDKNLKTSPSELHFHAPWNYVLQNQGQRHICMKNWLQFSLTTVYKQVNTVISVQYDTAEISHRCCWWKIKWHMFHCKVKEEQFNTNISVKYFTANTSHNSQTKYWHIPAICINLKSALHKCVSTNH